MEDKTFTLTLSIEELNLVVGALGELPAKVTMGLIQKIEQDVRAQQHASDVPAE